MFIETDLDAVGLESAPPGGLNSSYISGSVGGLKNRFIMKSSHHEIWQFNKPDAIDRWVFYGNTAKLLTPLLSPPAPAGSDLFADAPSISMNYRSEATDCTSFTVEAGEPNTLNTDDWTLCLTAWWKFTPTQTGPVAVDTSLTEAIVAGDSLDTILAVYTGDSLSALTVVGVNDDGGPNLTSRLVFTATAGTTYYIQIGTWDTSRPVRYVLTVQQDLGTPDEVSLSRDDNLVKIDDNRAMFFRQDSDTLWVWIESTDPMARTSTGDQATGSFVQFQGQLSGGSSTRWYDSVAIMANATDGYALIWGDAGSRNDQVFLVPFTVDGVEITSIGSPTQLGADNEWLFGEMLPYDTNHFVAVVREKTRTFPGPVTGLAYDARLRLYTYDGTLVSETDILGPSNYYAPGQLDFSEVRATIDSDKTIYLVEADTDGNTGISRLFIRTATWDGSAWTFTDGPNLTTPRPYNQIGWNPVQILSTGNILVDYVDGVLVEPGGWVNYTRHLEVRNPIDFSLIEEFHWGGDQANPYIWTGRPWTTITENFILSGYLDSAGNGDPVPRMKLIQYSPVWDLKAHHGKSVFRYISGSPDPIITYSAAIDTTVKPDSVALVGTPAMAIVGGPTAISDGSDSTYLQCTNLDTSTSTNHATVTFPALDIPGDAVYPADDGIGYKGEAGFVKAWITGRYQQVSGVSSGRPGFTTNLQMHRYAALADGLVDTSADVSQYWDQLSVGFLTSPFTWEVSFANTGADACDFRVYDVALHVEYVTPISTPVKNVITLKGPSTPEEGAADKHLGRFAIDPTTNHLSGVVEIASRRKTVWAKPVATFYKIPLDGSPPIGMGSTEFSSTMVTPDPTWKEINVFAETPPGATHYLIEIDLYSDSAMTTPLPASTELYVDCCFVPESGYDLRDGKQPYLDGDQPNAIWEGTAQNSTSIYGVKPPSGLSLMVLLDDDLAIYDPSASTPTNIVDQPPSTPPPPPPLI